MKKENKIEIHPITKELIVDLSKLRNWQITQIRNDEAVEKHSHRFDAMYFTDGVKELYSNGKKMLLPRFAAVFIPKGKEHAWSSTINGMGKVGHFHEGHGIHKITSAY